MEETPIFLSLCVKDNQNHLICHTQDVPLKKEQDFFVCKWEECITLENASSVCDRNCDFRFQVLDNRELLWVTFPVAATSFACGSEAYKSPRDSASSWKRRTFANSGRLKKYAYNMRISLRINYKASVTFKNNAMTTDYCIINVKFKIPPALLNIVREPRPLRKIVCALKLDEKLLYLGRPQEIQRQTGDALRVWKTRQEDNAAFPGLCPKHQEFWDDHLEHHREMTHISLFNGQLSSRAAPPLGNAVDGNQIQVAPILLQQNKSITFFFYHLKKEEEEEKQFVIVELFARDFPLKGSGIGRNHLLRRRATSNAFLSVKYRGGGGGKGWIEIFEIQLETLKG